MTEQEYTPEFWEPNPVFVDFLAMVPADILAEHDRQVAERAWDEGARHVYEDGGKCSFARDGDPCPYNPYRKETTGV